jgi:5-methylcytosine-specific restriction protein A
MKLQNKFDYSLDIPGNIVALCPNYHRIIHHVVPDQKRRIVQKLYLQRKKAKKAQND